MHQPYIESPTTLFDGDTVINPCCSHLQKRVGHCSWWVGGPRREGLQSKSPRQLLGSPLVAGHPHHQEACPLSAQQQSCQGGRKGGRGREGGRERDREGEEEEGGEREGGREEEEGEGGRGRGKGREGEGGGGGRGRGRERKRGRERERDVEGRGRGERNLKHVFLCV